MSYLDELPVLSVVDADVVLELSSLSADEELAVVAEIDACSKQ